MNNQDRPATEQVSQTELDHMDTEKELREAGRFSLAREVIILREQVQRADMAALIAEAAAPTVGVTFQHREAFMRMRYVSEGGHLVKLIWNSRDGVTPFNITVDGINYTHDLHKMRGPFLDRPEDCEAQWETRTVRAMMAAWDRVLSRLLLLGKIDTKGYEAARLDAMRAKGFHLHIGLRSLESGKYTDEM